MTERFARERVRHELVRRSLRVLRVSQPAPGFVRVTLGGEDLAGFASPGPADHVKLFFPVPNGERVSRDYTPLAFRPAGAEDSGDPELDIDFYLHGGGSEHDGSGHGADGGPAAAWAASARPGDEIEVAGPRGSALAPSRDDVDALILVADETALPSVARWLQALPGVPVTGLFTVADPEVADYLSADDGPGHDFRWFSGPDSEDRLAAELRAMAFGEGAFLFLAGEATSLIPLRRHLRRELGLPKAQVDVHGYWKRGTAGHDHHAPVDPSDDD